MLSFLYPIFLFILPLAAIPVIINLIRPRIKLRLDWPSLYLLRRAEKKRSRRRMKILEIILLILRVLIILTAVILASRPYLSFDGGVMKRDIVIVIDDSKSMTYQENGTSRLEIARDEIELLLNSLNNEDSVTLLRLSKPYEPIEGDIGELKNRLGSFGFGEASGCGTAVSQAMALLENAPGDKEIILFTDCQSGTFEDFPANINNYKLSVFDVRKSVGPTSNTALSSVEFPATNDNVAFIGITGYGESSSVSCTYGNMKTDIMVTNTETSELQIPIISSHNELLISDNSFSFDNSLVLPNNMSTSVDCYISPDLRSPFFTAGFSSLGIDIINTYPNSNMSIIVDRFMSVPEKSLDLTRDGSLLLLTTTSNDSGELAGLKLNEDAVSADYIPLLFDTPLYDARDMSPSLRITHNAELGGEWRIAARTITNRPAIVYRSYGDGEIWIILTPTGYNSDFTRHPSFIALLGDLIGRCRELSSGYARHNDFGTLESSVEFLNDKQINIQFPEMEYISESFITNASKAIDMLIPLTILLFSLLVLEILLAAYLTKTTK